MPGVSNATDNDVDFFPNLETDNTFSKVPTAANAQPSTDPAASGATAYGEAADFVIDPANDVTDLAHAIVGDAGLDDLLASTATNELLMFETLLTDAILTNSGTSFVQPDVVFVPNGDLVTATTETVLPEGVNGAFVAGEAGDPGTILLSEDLKETPELLDEVLLEELGEAIGNYAASQGYDVAPGDVGNRFVQVIRGETLEASDFAQNASGDDTVIVKLDGDFVEAKAADADDEPKNYEVWGYTEEEYIAAGQEFLDVYRQSGDVFHVGPEGGNFYHREELTKPSGVSSREWKRLFAIYGLPAPGETSLDTTYSGEYMGVFEFTRAILDGAIDFGEPLLIDELGPGGSGTVISFPTATTDLGNVSSGAVIDSLFQYIQNKNYGGAERSMITIEEFDDAVDQVLGAPDGIEVADYAVLQDNFADWEFGNPGDKRFTRNALAEMFESGAVTIDSSGSAGLDYLQFDVASADEIYTILNSWGGFEAYADVDDDGIANIDDVDYVGSFDDIEINPASGLTEDSEFISISDVPGGVTGLGDNDIRIVVYTDPAFEGTATKAIDMDVGSATYGEALYTMHADSEGNLTMDDVDGERVVTLTADELAAYDDAALTGPGRRLNGKDSENVSALVAELKSEGISDADIIEKVDHGTTSYVVYFDANGVKNVRFVNKQLEMPGGAYEPVPEGQLYTGNTKEGGAGWNRFVNFVNLNEKAENTAALGGVSAAAAGATSAAINGGAIASLGTAVMGVDAAGITAVEAPFFALVVGAAAGGAAMVYSAQSEKKMNELINIVGQPIDSLADIIPPADPGIVGEGDPAYFIPQDAEVLGSAFVPAEDGPYGVDTREFVYTRAGQADTVYVVSIDASDPGGARDGLVLHATKTFSETVDGVVLSDVTTYDSFGTETETLLDLDLAAEVEPITEAELLGDPETDLAHIEDKVYELRPDAEILEVHSAGPLTYVSYQLPGDTGVRVYMMERITKDGEAGHTYEYADGWLNGTVTGFFFEAFNYFQQAVNIYAELKHYYNVGTLALDVIDYFLQNVDFSGITSLVLGGSASTALTPRGSATVRHIGTAAAIVPFLTRGAVTAAQQWATAQCGPACFAFGGNSLFRATGHTSAVDLQGENGDIEEAIPEAPPNSPVPPALLDTHWQLGTQFLVASTNPHDLCFGMSTAYLKNRFAAGGIVQTDDYEIQTASQQAAPIENELANDTARDFMHDVYSRVEGNLSGHLDHFRRMANPSDTTVTNWLSPDVTGFGKELVLEARYATAASFATLGLELDFQHFGTDIEDSIDFIALEENKGKAFALNMVGIGNPGHEISFVHELDGSITLIEPNLGVVRFQDPSRLKDLYERYLPPGSLRFDLAEVKVATDPDSVTSPAAVLAWYKDLTGEDASTYGS